MGKFIVLLVVAVVGLGVPATAASAASSRVSIVSCGQVVTTDAVLHQRLGLCGTALVVAADGVDSPPRRPHPAVKLTAPAPASSSGAGRLDLSVQHVTVRGGTIEGFANGVANGNAGPGNQLDGLTLVDNTWGISWQASTLVVHGTTITGPNGIGPRAGPGYVRRCRSPSTTRPSGLTGDWWLFLGFR